MSAPELNPVPEPESPRPAERVFEDWGLEVNAAVHRYGERIAALEEKVELLRASQLEADALLRELLSELRSRDR